MRRQSEDSERKRDARSGCRQSPGPTNTRFLSATLPPLLQRRSLEKFSDGFALVSPESSTDKFSEPRASLTGIAYGSKCGVQEHSEVPPVCLPASIHLIVALSSSSVKGGTKASRVNPKPRAATASIDHVNTKRLDVRPPIHRRHLNGLFSTLLFPQSSGIRRICSHRIHGKIFLQLPIKLNRTGSEMRRR